MIKRRIRLELEALLNEMKINLENNYKDLAHEALKKLHTTLEDYHETGILKDKDYNKYKQVANEYSMRLKDYHH